VSGVTSDFGEVMSNRPIAFPIIAALLALCAANVSTPIIALLVSEMVGQSRAEAMSGLAFGAQGLAAAVSALFVGRITSRIGFRGLLTVSVPAGIMVYVAMWIVPGFWALAGLMAAQGLLQGAQIPALNALIAARAPRRRAGAVFGVVSSVNSLAFSGAPFLGGLLASAFGLRAVFPVSAAFLIAMFVLIGRATDAPQPTPVRVGVAEEA
jgi:MFS transporter, DHA1 family, multidrug resistance protein